MLIWIWKPCHFSTKPPARPVNRWITHHMKFDRVHLCKSTCIRISTICTSDLKSSFLSVYLQALVHSARESCKWLSVAVRISKEKSTMGIHLEWVVKCNLINWSHHYGITVLCATRATRCSSDIPQNIRLIYMECNASLSTSMTLSFKITPVWTVHSAKSKHFSRFHF